MGERLVYGQTPLEFFRSQLERAMQHQKVATSAFTEFSISMPATLFSARLRRTMMFSDWPT